MLADFLPALTDLGCLLQYIRINNNIEDILVNGETPNVIFFVETSVRISPEHHTKGYIINGLSLSD